MDLIVEKILKRKYIPENVQYIIYEYSKPEMKEESKNDIEILGSYNLINFYTNIETKSFEKHLNTLNIILEEGGDLVEDDYELPESLNTIIKNGSIGRNEEEILRIKNNLEKLINNEKIVKKIIKNMNKTKSYTWIYNGQKNRYEKEKIIITRSILNSRIKKIIYVLEDVLDEIEEERYYNINTYWRVF